jgi:hypothetical protein
VLLLPVGAVFLLFYIFLPFLISFIFVISSCLFGFLAAPYAVLASYLLARSDGASLKKTQRRLAQRSVAMLSFPLLFSVVAALLFLLGGLLDDLPTVRNSLYLVVSVMMGYLLIRMMVLPTVIAMEDRDVVDSIRRAWSLTGSKHWGTVIVAILTCVGCLIVVTALAILPAAAFAAGEEGEEQVWGAMIGFVIGAPFGSALYLSFAIAVQAAVYLRLTAAEAPSQVGMEGLPSVG